MAEGSASSTIEAIGPGFPPVSIPTIFVEGVTNLAPNINVTKFYLYRTDPDLTGKAAYKNQPVAQIVIPTLAFVTMALFFERGLQFMIDQGHVTKEFVQSVRDNEGK
jgi:hypothetical protein